MSVGQVFSGAFKVAGRTAVEAGKQYVRSSVRDFLSGGQGEDKAIERGNKSAIMAREMREAEYDRQIAEQQVQYQDERYAPLDSGDEFLDELYSKLGDIDNKMGKMLAHFVAQDKRADKQAILDRQANLSRKHEKEEKESTVSGGGGGSSGGSTSETESGGGSSGGGGGGSSEDSILETLLTHGGVDASELALRKAGAKFAQTRLGQAGVNLGKNVGGKAANLGKGALRMAPRALGTAALAGFALNAGMEAYNMANAKGNAVNESLSRNFDWLQGTSVTSTGELLDVGSMAERSKSSNFGIDQQTSAAYASGIASILSGGAFAIGEWIGGTSLSAAMRKSTLQRMGLDEEDYQRADRITKEGIQAVATDLFNQGYGPDVVNELMTRAIRVVSSVFAGMGDLSAPETWPVSMGDSTLKMLQGHKLTQIQKDLYEASLEVYQQVLADAEEFTPKTVEEIKKDSLKEDGSFIEYSDRESVKKARDFIKKNRLTIGIDTIGTLRSGKTHKPMDPSVFPYINFGDTGEKSEEFLKKHGFRKVKAHGWLYEGSGSSVWENAKKEGVYIPSWHSGDRKEHWLIEPGKEPTFLARGALLDSATSLGMVEADAINSLENSGNQIKDVIKDGFDGMNDEWFDDALMGYFMDSVLPGLVGALKTENKNLGIATPVSVFG